MQIYSLFRRMLILMAGFGTIVTVSRAQISKTEFHSLNLEQKLASNYVNCSLQDHKGFLWFGTYEGLTRYDGYSFKLYRHSISEVSSPGGNFITALMEDDQHQLWVGTSQDGISIMDPKTSSFRKIRSGPKKTDLPVDYIGCIYQDSQKNIWVGTYNGLCRYDKKTGNFISYLHSEKRNSLSGAAVMCMLEDRRGQLWVGTSQGLNIFHPQSGTFTRIIHNPENDNSPASNYIRCLMEDKQGNIWMGTDNAGISVYHPQTGKYFHYRHTPETGSLGDNEVWCIYQDKKDRIWAGTINGGLNLYQPNTGTFQKFIYSGEDANSLPSNSVTSILEDVSGNLWMTTHGGGVACLNSSEKAVDHISVQANKQGSLSHHNVKCFFEDVKGRLWIGTDGGGLNLYDKKTGTFRSFQEQNGLSSNMILDICQADETHLWLATWKGGICLFNTENFTVSAFLNDPDDKYSLSLNNVKGLLRMQDGRLWVATHGDGINIYDPVTHRFTRNTPILSVPQWGTGLLADKAGNIWITTYSGLFRMKDGQISGYNHNSQDNHSLSGYYVYDGLEDSRHHLWFATNNGLDLYDPQRNNFTNISDQLGIPGSVKSLAEDQEGHLWFSTVNQLIRLKSPGKAEICYESPSGQFNEGASLQSVSGDIYFGTTDGFLMVHPDRINRNSQAPSVYLTDFQLFNKSQVPGKQGSVLKNDIAETDEIRLDYNQSSFSFEFVALDYSEGRICQYSYQLEGFDKTPVFCGEFRKAVYTNLSPGTYTFRVRAANGEGVWNKQGAKVKIHIYPPFWLSPWAYLLYFLLAGLALWAYRKFILYKERIRSELERERELDRMKTRFFTNVSHELRTPLTLILGPIDKLLKQEAGHESRVNQLLMVQRNARRLLGLVNQLLDFSKLEAGREKIELQTSDFNAFIRYVAEPFAMLALEQNIKFEIKGEVAPIQFCFDPDKMEKVLTNLLSNAVKFTPKGGCIELKTWRTKHQIEITVWNSGDGIDPADQDHLFERYYQGRKKPGKTGTGIGLALTRDYVEMHQGKISVSGKQGEGALFSIVLPRCECEFPEKMDTVHPSETEDKLPVEEMDSKSSEQEGKPVLLLVDDHAEIRDFIRENLEYRYQILEASDGLQGMEIAADFMPDIVISDVMMPIADGMHFCRQLKNDRRTSHIPVILLTALSSDESRIAGYDTGADDYLGKPFSMEVLGARLRNLLENRRNLKIIYQQNIALEPENFTANIVDSELVRQIYSIVEIHMSDPDFNPDILARELLMSRSSLYQKIKALSGESVSIFVRNIRLKKAAELLKQKKLTISEVAYEVGFSHTQYFSKCFKEVFGVSPKEY